MQTHNMCKYIERHFITLLARGRFAMKLAIWQMRPHRAQCCICGCAYHPIRSSPRQEKQLDLLDLKKGDCASWLILRHVLLMLYGRVLMIRMILFLSGYATERMQGREGSYLRSRNP